jgi:hypothetical protein
MFTIVTIFSVCEFLPREFTRQLAHHYSQAPLSFFSSHYGMNVCEFTGDAGNTSQRAVREVIGPISATIILGLLGGAWYMYRQTEKKQLIRMAERKVKDDKE